MALRHKQPGDRQQTLCEACDQPVNDGDLVYDCAEEGFPLGVIHAKCLGYPDDTDADGFVDSDGEPLDERPDPYPFKAA